MHFCIIIATLALIFLAKPHAKIIKNDNELDISGEKGIECEGGKLVDVSKFWIKLAIAMKQTSDFYFMAFGHFISYDENTFWYTVQIIAQT